MPEKNIEDYLHLYLGCEVVIQKSFTGFGRYLVKGDKVVLNTKLLMELGEDGNCTYTPNYIKPILRNLNDMTEEEKLQLAYNHAYPHVKFSSKESALNSMYGRYGSKWFTAYQDEFLFLLSKHFDLFGLIEAGIAIDKTTLTK